MDIQKLKYDLAMQCALVEVLKEQSTAGKSPMYDMRVSMLENFKKYYVYYSALHGTNFDELTNVK